MIGTRTLASRFSSLSVAEPRRALRLAVETGPWALAVYGVKPEGRAIWSVFPSLFSSSESTRMALLVTLARRS